MKRDAWILEAGLPDMRGEVFPNPGLLGALRAWCREYVLLDPLFCDERDCLQANDFLFWDRGHCFGYFPAESSSPTLNHICDPGILYLRYIP